MKNALLLVGAAFGAATAADAAVNVYISDDGTDLTMRVLGSIDLSGFTPITPFGTEPGSDELGGYNGILYSGDPRQGLQAYAGLTGNNRFGGNSLSFANSGAGTGFGINGAYTPARLLLARTYVSNAPIDSGASFLYRTIDSLGLTRGTYTYASPSDTITVRIGQAAPAVPEAATWSLMVAGFGAIGATLRRRRPAPRAAV